MRARLPLAALVTALTLALASPAAAQPNFVFVLTDDLTSDLIAYMPQVQALQREGASFSRYIVTDSLCCPSRASILSGRYPHSTGVITNIPPWGGFEVFHDFDEESTFATALARRGYRTGLFGKYLNGYFPYSEVDGERPFVPPGWTDWAVGGEAYRSFDYSLAVKRAGRPARTMHFARRPRDYMTDVISRFGREFIAGAAKQRSPFLVELSTYAPHAPATPAPRDANGFQGLFAPRGPLFDAPQLTSPPLWLSAVPLSAEELGAIDAEYRRRAQAVRAVDKLLADVRATLRKYGVAQNTYIVFSSDNGYHLGERRLAAGKQTAWDHDVRVPLVVVGPGIAPGKVIDQLTANVDLRPTFQELARAPLPARVEGRSLAPLLVGAPVPWRSQVLIEHRGIEVSPRDPDAQGPRQGKPPSYAALRFTDALYVEYDIEAFAPEYYDLATDPDARVNLYPSLPPERRAELANALRRYRNCSGAASCQKADAGA